MILNYIRTLYILWFDFISFVRILRLRASVALHRSRLSIGQGLRIEHHIVFQGKGQLVINDRVTFGFRLAGALNAPILIQPRTHRAIVEINSGRSIMNGCEIIACEKIKIGKDFMIGPSTVMMDSDFHGLLPFERKSQGVSSPIKLEDNVWIGSRCIILKGVHIGEDAVVAAVSVVTDDVQSGNIVGGCPAKVIGSVYSNIQVG